MSPAAVTEDAPVAQEQWINPDARPQGRRLTPIVQDGIVRAWRAGVPNSRIARVCGVSHTTVRRVIERMTPDLEQALSDLSEIADAERELRAAGAELGVDPTRLENAIAVIRYGHVFRKNLERDDASA